MESKQRGERAPFRLCSPVSGLKFESKILVVFMATCTAKAAVN